MSMTLGNMHEQILINNINLCKCIPLASAYRSNSSLWWGGTSGRRLCNGLSKRRGVAASSAVVEYRTLRVASQLAVSEDFKTHRGDVVGFFLSECYSGAARASVESQRRSSGSRTRLTAGLLRRTLWA